MSFNSSLFSTDMALALARAVVGLVVAGHGAQKALGLWGGPGISGWTQGMTRMSIRPSAAWAYITAATELVGGVALALGFLIPLVAGLITVQMAVAIQRVHWAKGFWNGKGGIEFPLTLGLIAAISGLADAGAWSLDRFLGTPLTGAGPYVIVALVGWLAYYLSSRRPSSATAAGKPA